MILVRIKNVIRGIRNIIKWIPILYQDRDWDYVFLLVMLERKFTDMANYHENHGHLVRSKETARELRVAAEYCRKIIDEDESTTGIFPTTRMGKSIIDGSPVLAYNKLQYIMMVKRESELRRQLGRLIGRKLHTWWD